MKTDLTSPGESWVEPARREIYERIQTTFEAEGIRLDRFYGNPSYFRRGPDGVITPLAGSHPTLVHWPLESYAGGSGLVAELERRAGALDELVGDGSIGWIEKPYWHSTVFSPVHSSDPERILAVKTDMADVVREHLAMTPPYELVFTRILITADCGIKAVGYCGGSSLESLRERLRAAVPHGSASALVHISLGNFLKEPPADCLPGLRSFLRTFGEDRVVLGRLTVDALSYAIYHGPFIRMRVEPVFRVPLGGARDGQRG